MGNVCCRHSRWAHGGAPFFGRLLLSLIFILGGLGKIFDFQGSVDVLRTMGIPGAEAYIFVGLLLELIGGILLALGWFTRLGTVLLMIFLLPTTFIIHSFWMYEGAAMVIQFSMFMKNIAIYGGLIILYGFGPGMWSLDASRCKKSG